MKHHSGWEYLKAAQKNGLEVHMGHGDHCVVKAPSGRGYEVIPLHKELSNGVECKLSKWFKSLGIILCLILGIVYITIYA